MLSVPGMWLHCVSALAMTRPTPNWSETETTASSTTART